MSSEEKSKSGLIVEDETQAGGVDKTTGADVIRPKSPSTGKVNESTDPTDKREGQKKK